MILHSFILIYIKEIHTYVHIYDMVTFRSENKDDDLIHENICKICYCIYFSFIFPVIVRLYVYNTI